MIVTNNEKFLLLKSKQFTSNLVKSKCSEIGINVRYPITDDIPEELIDFVFRQIQKIYDIEKNSNVIKQRILHLQKIKTYKGIRHRKGLPVRGQRTHTNSKTFKKLRNQRVLPVAFQNDFNDSKKQSSIIDIAFSSEG